MPSCASVPTPKLPIVNAIAPNAPSGAAFMMNPTMTKNADDSRSMNADERCAGRAEALEREAEQHRDQQHLQNVALRERVHDARRNDVEHERDRALPLCRR